MIKYIALGISVLVLLGGCKRAPHPKPQPKPAVAKKNIKPKPVAKTRHYKKGEVPPLPEREVDVDMDNMVDQAANEVLNNDNAV